MEEQKKYAEAEAKYREAIRVDPECVDAHINLGLLLKKLGGNDDEAKASYGEAIWLDPNCARAHTVLGSLLSTLGKDAEAEASHREAIRVNPKYANAHWNLSTILEKRGDLDAAIEEARAYIDNGNPDNDGEARLAELRAKKAA